MTDYFNGTAQPRQDLGDAAIEWASHNWPVFPLNGKIPAIAGGRGVLDATTDTTIVGGWWAGRYRGCNIGGRVPESMFVIDVDPRHGGLATITDHQQRHDLLP